jgi:uncharacterized protein YceK
MRIGRLLFVFSLFILLSTSGCLSVARLSDLPQDSESAYTEKTDRTDRYGWFEHTVSLAGVCTQLVFDSAQEALQQEGFTITCADADKGCIQGQRGLRANEWGMVSGIYLREDGNAVKVKVICQITQDFTGGWRQSYAVNIANRIVGIVNTKKQ